MDVTENQEKETLELMIMSASPGILDGDEYRIRILLAEGTSLHLKTQAYQRLFQMEGGASQSMEVVMEKNASLIYLPHPTVPHRGSSFIARNKIHMAEGSSLVWGEVLSCGRKLSGESFQYSCFHSITEIHRENRLVVKENLMMAPGTMDYSVIGQMEGYSHQATLICIHEDLRVEDLISETGSYLAETGFLFGASMLPVNGFILRLLGNRGEQMFDCLRHLSAHVFHHAKHLSLKEKVYAI
jgi:urease accessory protein